MHISLSVWESFKEFSLINHILSHLDQELLSIPVEPLKNLPFSPSHSPTSFDEEDDDNDDKDNGEDSGKEESGSDGGEELGSEDKNKNDDGSSTEEEGRVGRVTAQSE